MKFLLIKSKKTTTLLLGIGLILALLLAGRQELSWAAPGQHPDQQTVPPRPPTDTPAAATDPSPPNGNDDDRDGDSQIPLFTPSATPETVFTSVTESPTASPVSESEEDLNDAQSPMMQTPAQDQGGSGGAETDNGAPPFPELTSEPPDNSASNETKIEIAPPGASPAGDVQFDTVAGAMISREGSGLLYWLYALILGVALTLFGIFLIRKS